MFFIILYNCSTPTFLLWASQTALNQPVHGHGYILIFLDRMHLCLLLNKTCLNEGLLPNHTHTHTHTHTHIYIYIYITSICKNITTNTIIDNYRNYDTDFSKGFIRGNIFTAISQSNESSLPKRYTQALTNLTQNPNIIISPANKSGGVVIMHKQRYVDKIISLLEDKNIYKIYNLTIINKTAHTHTHTHTHIYIYIYNNPSIGAGCDTRSFLSCV